MLTGSSDADLFVFAQPIGNDTVHNFDAAQDTVDLIGYAGFASFADVQAHLADDAAGNAVLTLGDGQTITLKGVVAASLTAGNFVFDQTPVSHNAGSMAVSDGAVLPLSGTIDNSGTIALEASGHGALLELTGSGVTLQGGGEVTLTDGSIIAGTTSHSVLNNIDNTISGAGQIGSGDGNLTLVNGALGAIAATVAGSELVLNTGNTIVNDGVLKAMNGGTLKIEDRLSGSGTLAIGVGTMELAALVAADVLFSTVADAYGALVVDHAADFTGAIYNFAGTGPQSSDAIDLKDITFQGATVSYNDDSGTDTGGILTIYDANQTVIDTVHFATGEFQTMSFNLADDGQGGLLITDPSTATTPSAETTTQNTSSPATISTTSSPDATTLTGGSDVLTLDNAAHEVSATDQTLNNGDKIAGGSGADTLKLDVGNGDHSFTFGDGNYSDIGLTNFEEIKLSDANATTDHAVTITFDANFHNNGSIAVDGSALTHVNDNGLTVDAHLATQDSFTFIGSSHADILIGSAKADAITGGSGGDTMTGDGGNDTFVFKATGPPPEKWSDLNYVF